MTTRNYPRLTIETFGAHLLASGDLDPVYIALNRVGWDEEQRARFLVAYWCTYHVGLSCWFSEQSDDLFWAWLLIAAANEKPCPIGGRWPRAPERRHWRGHNSTSCVIDLAGKYPGGPLGMIRYISRPNLLTRELLSFGQDALDTYPFALIANRVREHVAFGPWIAFKVADMLERCCGVPVRFGLDDAMYDSPTKAAMRVWRYKAGVADEARPLHLSEAQAVRQVVDHLLLVFKDQDAPGGGRRVGFQEVETILCKWGSHMSGHYPLNHDLVEIGTGLMDWDGVSPAAKEFLAAMPTLKENFSPALVTGDKVPASRQATVEAR